MIAVIGANALWLMYLWLLSANGVLPRPEQGYTRSSAGVRASALDPRPYHWLIWPAKAE